LSEEEPAAPPDHTSAGLDREQLTEAKQYGRLGLICDLADKGIDLVFLALMALVVARPLDDGLARWSILADFESLRLVALLLITILLHVAVSFPLSLYSGHFLEHRFGLSKQTFRGWLWRYTKRCTLAVAFSAVIFLGLYWIIWLTGPWWWIVAAGGFFVVSVVLGQLTPVLIMPLFHKIEKLDMPELSQRLNRLAGGTGLSIEGVYRIVLSEETVKANAMLAGLGRTRRVLLGDTLLADFTPEEIEVIFAHEIGHHVCRHIRKMILSGMVYIAAGFWLCHGLLTAWVDWPGQSVDFHLLPVYTLPMVMFALTAFAMLLEPVQNFFSRRFERQSDRYALERTGAKEAYISAFQKLARQNKDDPDPHPLEVLLFHGHPPIAERLAMAERR